jgi:multidrug efflux system membrane fusion protein
MRRSMLYGVGAVAAAAAAFGIWRMTDGEAKAQAQSSQPAQPPGVPVTTAAPRKQDIPVYLPGLGTVQAFNVVEIKAQVDGNLVALPAKEGQEVHKGDIIAEIDPRPYQAALDKATAQRQEDASQVQSAQLDLQRYQALAKRQFAPVQQVDDQQANVNKQNAAIAADDAAIETAKINLGYCVIRAPIDGRVSLYQVDVGNLIQAASSTGIVSITQDKPIAVVFTLPEAQLVRVVDAAKKGDLPVQVVATDDKNVLATGTLMTPNNTIDTNSGTISLKAQFANEDDHLWPGQFVDARIQVDTLHNVVTIPPLTIQHGPDGLFVYTIKPDKTVAQANIQVGYQADDAAVVTKGLNGDETLVLTGQSRIAPGTRVNVTDPSKAQAADAAG